MAKAKARGLLAAVPKRSASRSANPKKQPRVRAQPLAPANSGLQADIDAATEARRQAAEQTFKYNNPTSESNQFGSLETIQNPDGTITKTTKLNAAQQEQQDLLDSREIEAGKFAQEQLGKTKDSYSQNWDLSGLANDPNKFDFNAERARIEGDVYNRYKQDLDTQFSQQNTAFEDRMANSGVAVGSPQYNRLKAENDQNQGRAYQDARSQALQMGGDEMSRSFDLSMGARDRAVNEYTMGRDRPYQEMTNILGTMRGPQSPNFQARAGTEVGAVDVEGLAGQAKSLAEADKQRRFDAKQNNLNRQASLQAAAAGRGGGGFNADQMRQQAQIENEAYDQRLQIQQKYKQTSPKANPLVNAGSGLLSGIGAGLGNAVGNYFTR